VRIGKLPLPSDPAFYTHHIAALGAGLLPVHASHALALFSLPRHHGDPFDRLLISQAQAEGLTIATQDAAFAAYGIPTVW